MRNSSNQTDYEGDMGNIDEALEIDFGGESFDKLTKLQELKNLSKSAMRYKSMENNEEEKIEVLPRNKTEVKETEMNDEQNMTLIKDDQSDFVAEEFTDDEFSYFYEGTQQADQTFNPKDQQAFNEFTF